MPPLITFIADPNEPDLYNDVTDLPDPIIMKVPIGISNTHPTAELWFKVSIVDPPEDYDIYESELGSLPSGSSGIFTMILERDMPV
jgi:hypothetical protein